MKKVLALALALVMVCTMALALDIGNGPYSEPATEGEFVNVNPGTVIKVEASDLEAWGLSLYDATFAPEVKNAAGKVVAKNVLNVTFSKGGDLVASQGWVEVAKGVYEYQIALKENDAAKLDEKVDLVLGTVTVKATGVVKTQTATLDGLKKNGNLVDGHYEKVQFDVGYEVVEMPLTNKNIVNYEQTPAAELFKDYERGIIAKVVKGEGTANAGNLVIFDNAYGTCIIPVKVGQEVFIANDVKGNDFAAKELTGVTVTNDIDGLNPTSLSADVKVGAYNLIDWTSDMNVYAKNYRTGKIVKLNETYEDGVLSFTVPAYSYVISVDGTIAGAATSAPADVTNPGTGANDVVGVAAALAVVALVSGAAISLKK